MAHVRVTPGVLPSALRARLRITSCNSPFGPRFARSNLLQANLVARAKRSRRFCISGFLPFSLRAALRACKIAPGDFVSHTARITHCCVTDLRIRCIADKRRILTVSGARIPVFDAQKHTQVLSEVPVIQNLESSVCVLGRFDSYY
jgi:hypothetical protein